MKMVLVQFMTTPSCQAAASQVTTPTSLPPRPGIVSPSTTVRVSSTMQQSQEGFLTLLLQDISGDCILVEAQWMVCQIISTSIYAMCSINLTVVTLVMSQDKISCRYVRSWSLTWVWHQDLDQGPTPEPVASNGCHHTTQDLAHQLHLSGEK